MEEMKICTWKMEEMRENRESQFLRSKFGRVFYFFVKNQKRFTEKYDF